MIAEQNGSRRWEKRDYWQLAGSFIVAAILTWGIHEGAHWLMGNVLGYDMWITFNQVGLVQGAYASDFHQMLVSMAGPVITWLQAIGAFLLIRRSEHLWIYAFLFLAFWMRAMAMGISFLTVPNDEARVSLLLGLPMWVVPAISVIFLLVLTYQGSRLLNVGWKGNVVSYLMASLMSTIIVFSDQFLFFAK